MNVPGIVFLFGIYTMAVAAVVAVIFYSANRRRRRDSGGELPIPNVAGLRLRRPDSEHAASWQLQEALAHQASPVIFEQEPALVGAPAGESRTASFTVGTGAPHSHGSGDAPAALLHDEPRDPVALYTELISEPLTVAGDAKPAGTPVPPPFPAGSSLGAAMPSAAAMPAAAATAMPAAAAMPAAGHAGPFGSLPASAAADSQVEGPPLAAEAAADPAERPPADIGSGVAAADAAVPAGVLPAVLLANAFPAGGTLLREGLRTLEVTPNRTIEPGTAVRAAFTLRNPGGAVATGFRVRFRLPEGMTYAAGSASIDGSPLDDEAGTTALLAAGGVAVGDVPAGGEKRVALDFIVADTIENGTTIALQAALASADVPVIGSNVVRLVVRSRPILQNDRTTLAFGTSAPVRPGDELGLTATIHNSGQSSAHDLVVMLPVPAHTTVVPDSLTIDGRPLADPAAGGPFRFARPVAVAPLLPPGATIAVGYRVRVDSPLEDATPIAAHGSVYAQEVADFALLPVVATVASAASFGGGETSLRIDCADEVEPGQRVPIVLAARNIGTATARDLTLSIGLPEGMAYIAGSLTIDGAFAPDRGTAPNALALGDLEPFRTIEIAITAIVRSPLAHGCELRPTGRVTWSGMDRSFERLLTVRSMPRFPADFNRIERETPQRVGPGETVAFTVALANMGTDTAVAPRLALTADDGLRVVGVRDGTTELPIGADGTVALDALEPGVSRRLRVEGRIAGIIEDHKQVRLAAALLPAPGTRIELGAPAHVVESLPKFIAGSSRITLDTAEAPRLKRVSRFRLTLMNEGTDCGHDIRVALSMPDELLLDAVDHATVDANAIVFGEIPAGQTRTAILSVRLVGIVAGGDPMVIAARVTGANVVPLNLSPIELETRGEAAFSDGATLACAPAASVEAGGELGFTLRLHNSGDGPAKHLTARISRLSNAVYAQGSTTVNGVALADHAGSSLLLGDDGLHLADVGVGVDVVIAWRAIVNIPLPPGTVIETAARVRWDASPELTVSAPPVEVRSESALPVIAPELPFSVLGAIAARPGSRA